MQNHLARGFFLLLLMVLLVGCQQTSHTLEWRGALATAHTLFGADPSFHRVTWYGYRAGRCKSAVCSTRPAFSVRFPDGKIIKPGEFTLARLKVHGAEERIRDGGTPVLPARRLTSTWMIKSDAGNLTAQFDEKGRLESISISVSSGEGRAAVGDRHGRRMVTLPATREELVEVFGEPESESERVQHPLQFG